MNIQSAFNSILSDFSNVAFRSGIIQHMKKTEESTSKYFGDMAKSKEERQGSILKRTKLKEGAKINPEERVARGQQRIIEHEYETSGQREADALAEEEYSNQQNINPGEAKAVQNVVEQTETFHNQKEAFAQRKEYLKKPRILNRHGTIYQEVIKDGK